MGFMKKIITSISPIAALASGKSPVKSFLSRGLAGGALSLALDKKKKRKPEERSMLDSRTGDFRQGRGELY